MTSVAIRRDKQPYWTVIECDWRCSLCRAPVRHGVMLYFPSQDVEVSHICESCGHEYERWMGTTYKDES